MGSWGITALESDNGLDTVGIIREYAADGTTDLKEILSALKQDELAAPPAGQGVCHSGIEALAEVILKYLGKTVGDLDYAHEDVKFSPVSSFTAEKEDIRWIREYLLETLNSAERKTEIRWGGWLRQADWNAWRERMQTLIDTMDTLIAIPSDSIELQNKWLEECEEMGEMEMR